MVDGLVSFNTVRPAIRIFKTIGAGGENSFLDLLYGIEEEGIPFTVEDSEFEDVLVLAHEASLSSNLAVGIGITDRAMALHYDKLPVEKPVFVIDRELDRAGIRAFGMNAARLVKRMPFIDYEP